MRRDLVAENMRNAIRQLREKNAELDRERLGLMIELTRKVAHIDGKMEGLREAIETLAGKPVTSLGF